MPFEVTFSRNFLNRLFSLPSVVTNKLPEVVNLLQENPHNRYTCQIRNHDNLYRIYLTKNYRIFYSYKQNWVKLYSILKRQEDTYKNINIPEEEEPVFYAPDFEDEITPPLRQEGLISRDQLNQWRIPEEYWQPLLEVQNEDDLLEINIPDYLLERIIDNLFVSSFDEINNSSYFKISDSNDLNDALSGNLNKFLLRLSDKQQEYLDLESDAPILIKGGPGTGKSILAIYRAQKYIQSGEQPVLFSTYTQELANYSKELLCRLLGTDEQGLIDYELEIYTADSLAIRFFTERYGSPNLVSEQIALYCLKQAIAMGNLRPQVQNSIFSLGSKYILEEIKLVIEARGIDIYDKYEQIERYGRRFPLNRVKRQAIWDIYQTWKDILGQSGYITIEQVRAKALEITRGLTTKPYKRVLIDEAQELSPITLKFLAELVSSPERLYLTADVQQSLYQRSFSWGHLQASLDFNGIERTLRKSFRNTMQIGQACPRVLSNEMPEINQFSELQGSLPQLFLTNSPIKQAERLKQFFQESSREYRLPVNSGIILTPDRDLGVLIASQLSYLGLKSEFIETKDINHDYTSLKVIKLEASKGLEFSFVAIIGLEEGILPNTMIDLPEEEREEVMKQERQLFYVGCSRAMRTLLVCGSKSNPSQFLQPLHGNRYWNIEESTDG